MEPKKLWHLHAQHSLVQSCCRQKMSCIYACRVASVMSYPLGLCGLWPARHLCQWDSPGENTGLATTDCHTLLEHYISCCSSCQLLWVPCTNRTPVTPAAVPPPHLALTGANPSTPGKPQEQTLVNNPHAEVWIKAQLKTRGSVIKKDDPKPSHQLYKLQIKFTWSNKQTLSMEYKKGLWELPQKKMQYFW